MNNTPYTKEFYDKQRSRSFISAMALLSFVLEQFPGTGSVTDMGCGVGTWLAVARLMGKKVLGRDFFPPKSELLLELEEFERISFTAPVPPAATRFDLCLSLEVAEHLPEEHAEQFIVSICGQSDLVLFGAAIPGQGGTSHIHERWPSYWAALFAERGYACFDVVRQRFWDDYCVAYYYAQNTLLYCKKSRMDLIALCSSLHQPMPLDIIHPRTRTSRSLTER